MTLPAGRPGCRSPSRRAGGARRLGAGARRARATRSRRPTRPSSTSCGAVPAHAAVDASGRDVGLPDGPDGQLRGRPPQPRRRRGRPAGPDAHRRRGRRRQLLREPGPAGGVRARRATARAAGCTSWDWSPTAASTPAGSTSRRASSSRRARACRTSSSTPSPTGATRRPRAGAGYIAELERWLEHAGRIAHGQRPLLRDGSRQALGSGQEGIRRDRPRRGPPRADAAAAAVESRTSADETDEFIEPTVIGDYDGDGGRGRRCSTSTSARIAPVS